jgi:hypothetical protein
VLRFVFGLGRTGDPDLPNPPALGVDDLDVKPVDIEGFADGGHVTEMAEEESTNGLEPFPLDGHPESVDDLIDVRRADPFPSSTTGSASTSYSSRISPTISSRRSSSVTSPAVPPYSSTTMAL